jgi:hypothetical protein
MLCLGIGITFYSIHDDFYEQMQGIFGDLGLGYPDGVLENSNMITMAIYALVLTPTLPAICEELLFRGVIMRGLNEKGVVYGVVFSSFLFALMHGSVAMILLQFLLGLGMAIITHVTKNHYYAVAIHFSNNLFLSIVMALSQIFTGEYLKLGNLVSAFTSVFGIAFLLIASFYFLNKYLANYKRKILGVEPTHSEFEEIEQIKYKSQDGFYQKPFYKDDQEEKRLNVPFLYKGKFINYNKNSKLPLVIILSIISFVLAVLNLFL